MDSLVHKTPVKKVFSPCENSPNGTFGRAFTTEGSPSYVKWDFLRPSASENIMNAASKLENELNECNLKRKRSLVDSPKSCFQQKVTKIKGGFKARALSRSVRRLKDTIEEVLNQMTTTDSKTSPTKPHQEETGFGILTERFEGKEHRKKTVKNFLDAETKTTTEMGNDHEELELSTKTTNHKAGSVPPSDILFDPDFADDSIFELIDNKHWGNDQNNDEISSAFNDSFDMVLLDCSQRIELQFTGNLER